MTTDVARLAMEFTSNGARRVKTDMEALQSGSIRLTRATDQQIAAQTRLRSSYQSISVASRRSVSSFRMQKGAMQQVGYQVGDFATQVGAGQSALVAFGQQASQLAMIMGPGGALLGAVIAIGAGIAGAFVRGMSEGEEATRSLKEQIDELNISYSELTDNQREALELERARNQQQANTLISRQENELERLREIEENLLRLQRMGENDPELADVFNADDLQETQEQITALAGKIDTARQRAAESKKEFDDMLSGIGPDAKDAADKIQEMVTAAEQQAATLGMSSRAVATYEAALAGANAEQILAIDTAFRRIEAYNQEQEAIKKTAKEEQERIKQRQQQEQALASMRAQADPAFAEFNRYADQIDQIEQFNITAEEKERLREAAFAQHQQRMAQIAQEGTNQKTRALEQSQQAFANSQQQIQQMTASVFGNTVGVMREFAEEGSAAWVALTLAQKGIMAAQAIMAANLAAAMTRTAIITPLDPSSPARAEAQAQAIRFLGIADAAAIMATGVAETAPSFAGGGFTGEGSRSGGVDGKGGFPAILHPNETVIDHTMGQGMGGNTYIEVIDQSTGQKTYQHQSVMDASGNRQVRLLIRDMMREDIQKGEFDKQMQTSFGVRRRARRV